MEPSFFIHSGLRILEFRFSQQVLSHLSPADGGILQAAQQNRPHNIKNLSDPIKEAMLAITGPEAAGPLGIPFDAASSKPRVTHDHLKNSDGENAITWTLIHRSYLPPDTQGVNSKCKTGDRIVFDSMVGAPYLQGDHRSANPKGAIDFACSLNCRDLVWIDSQFCFVSDAYVWDKQYLAQIRKQSQDRLIYDRSLNRLHAKQQALSIRRQLRRGSLRLMKSRHRLKILKLVFTKARFFALGPELFSIYL